MFFHLDTCTFSHVWKPTFFLNRCNVGKEPRDSFLPASHSFLFQKKKQVLRKVGETVKLEVFVEGDSSLPLRPATATDRPHVEHQWPTASPGIENPSTSPRRFLLDLRWPLKCENGESGWKSFRLKIHEACFLLEIRICNIQMVNDFWKRFWYNTASHLGFQHGAVPLWVSKHVLPTTISKTPIFLLVLFGFRFNFL